jgi:predicted amidohydrolase
MREMAQSNFGLLGERIKGRESICKVAAIQTDPRLRDKKSNIQRQIEMIETATRQGSLLMVLPELGNTGYVFNSRAEILELAEEVPDGLTCQSWIKASRDLGIYICGGFAEREDHDCYNSAILVGPNGFIGKYRKTHLWDEEKLFFEPGNLGFPIFHLPFGRVAMMICYDGFFPEVARILALQGADIICDPTAWPVVPDADTPEKPISPLIHLASANVNGVFIVCADRIGTERGCTFLGNSCVVGPSGFISGPASSNREEIVSAEINIVQSRYKQTSPLSDRMADRRSDLYDYWLGYYGPEKREG